MGLVDPRTGGFGRVRRTGRSVGLHGFGGPTVLAKDVLAALSHELTTVHHELAVDAKPVNRKRGRRKK